jgi:hypothetical protein
MIGMLWAWVFIYRGIFKLSGDEHNVMRYGDKKILLHRLSFAFYKNCKCLLPSTYLVCHVCNNRACWNPEHLKVGDALENALDRSENVA